MQTQNEQEIQHHQNKYRTKEHEALLKLKNAEANMDMMKRRFKYLQVKDQQNRSKTIQHQRKINLHELQRSEMKKEKARIQKAQRIRQKQIQKAKQKNLVLKQSIEENIKEVADKIAHQKAQQCKQVKQHTIKNQQLVHKFKQHVYKQKQERRKSINDVQERQKINVSRYRQNKKLETYESKSLQSDSIIKMAAQKEKQLQKLSRMQQEMIKKNSESLQVSQVMRNRLRQVLGDQRRFTKLPQIRSKTSTRGSTGHTQIVLI